MARRRNPFNVKITENVSQALVDVGAVLNGRGSAEIGRIMYEGASMIASAAKDKAPQLSGQLAKGIYVASQTHNGFVALTRRGKRLNSPLKNPPRSKQALAVSSVFYTRFVEGGVKGKSGPSKQAISKRQWKGLGAQRKRPFFQQAKKQMRKQSIEHVQRRLVQLVEGAWQQ